MSQMLDALTDPPRQAAAPTPEMAIPIRGAKKKPLPGSLGLWAAIGGSVVLGGGFLLFQEPLLKMVGMGGVEFNPPALTGPEEELEEELAELPSFEPDDLLPRTSVPSRDPSPPSPGTSDPEPVPDPVTPPVPAPAAPVTASPAPDTADLAALLADGDRPLDEAEVSDLLRSLPAGSEPSRDPPARPRSREAMNVAVFDPTDQMLADLDAARRELREGDPARAAGLYGDLSLDFPDEPQVLVGLVAARAASGDLLGAAESWDALRRLTPYDQDRLVAALQPLTTHAPALAERRLAELLRGGSQDAVALALLGKVQTMQGRFDAAIRSLEAARALQPQTPRILFNLAVAYDQAGRVDQAIPAYRAALRADSRADRPSLDQGAVLRRLGYLTRS